MSHHFAIQLKILNINPDDHIGQFYFKSMQITQNYWIDSTKSKLQDTEEKKSQITKKFFKLLKIITVYKDY